MSEYVKYLTDEDGNIIYPRTRDFAVTDELGNPIQTVPKASVADEGKFLRVGAEGKPVWETVPTYEGGSY